MTKSCAYTPNHRDIWLTGEHHGHSVQHPDDEGPGTVLEAAEHLGRFGFAPDRLEDEDRDLGAKRPEDAGPRCAWQSALKPRPSADYLRECLDYNPGTGELVWRHRPRHHFPREAHQKRWNNLYAGRLAFRDRDKDGYLSGAVSRTKLRAHRVIWAMTHGEWPAALVDHKDGNPGNNRLDNLREATATENQRNKRYCGKASGFKGVYVTGPRFSDQKRYQAMIMVDGRPIFLGLHSSAEQAHAAYQAAARQYFGEFARFA